VVLLEVVHGYAGFWLGLLSSTCLTDTAHAFLRETWPMLRILFAWIVDKIGALFYPHFISFFEHNCLLVLSLIVYVL
jgi:hypothetical protein